MTREEMAALTAICSKECADLMPRVVKLAQETDVALKEAQERISFLEKQLVAFDAILDGNAELAEKIAPGAFEVRRRGAWPHDAHDESGIKRWLEQTALHCSAATPGPWRWAGDSGEEYVHATSSDGSSLSGSSIWDNRGHLRRRADGEFIAYARDALPQAIALLKAASAASAQRAHDLNHIFDYDDDEED